MGRDSRTAGDLKGAEGVAYRQGYLVAEVERNVRVRVAGERATLTVKGKTGGAEGITRLEYQYDIPLEEGHELLDRLCLEPLIEKTRYTLDHEGHEWVIDVFEGDNAGLVVAEIELDSETESFVRPGWLGPEVSHDPRYLNARLVREPYCGWGAT